jgi:hypothetical protein
VPLLWSISREFTRERQCRTIFVLNNILTICKDKHRDVYLRAINSKFIGKELRSRIPIPILSWSWLDLTDCNSMWKRFALSLSILRMFPWSILWGDATFSRSSQTVRVRSIWRATNCFTKLWQNVWILECGTSDLIWFRFSNPWTNFTCHCHWFCDGRFWEFIALRNLNSFQKPIVTCIELVYQMPTFEHLWPNLGTDGLTRVRKMHWTKFLISWRENHEFDVILRRRNIRAWTSTIVFHPWERLIIMCSITPRWSVRSHRPT